MSQAMYIFQRNNEPERLLEYLPKLEIKYYFLICLFQMTVIVLLDPDISRYFQTIIGQRYF